MHVSAITRSLREVGAWSNFVERLPAIANQAKEDRDVTYCKMTSQLCHDQAVEVLLAVAGISISQQNFGRERMAVTN